MRAPHISFTSPVVVCHPVYGAFVAQSPLSGLRRLLSAFVDLIVFPGGPPLTQLQCSELFFILILITPSRAPLSRSLLKTATPVVITVQSM